MKKSELKTILKKGDILIIMAVVILSLLWFMGDFFRNSEDKTVNICLDGEICHSIRLSYVEDKEVFKAGSCVVEVSPEGASFISSDCPDGLCVKRGLMTRVGDAMACVPEGVTVEIVGTADRIDGIAY